MKHIPNLFTLLNLVFGCLAIIVILQSGIGLVTTADGVQMMNMPEQIFFASLFIGLAAVIDFFDGCCRHCCCPAPRHGVWPGLT